MSKLRLTFDIQNFSRPINYLPPYTPPTFALPSTATRAGRAELRTLQQRWLMWEAAGAPIRDIEALKWFAFKWINRDDDGKTKKQVESEGGHFSFCYLSEVLTRLEKLAGGSFPLGGRRACEHAMNPFISARAKAAEKRKEAARDGKPTPLGMNPESKLRLRMYEKMISAGKEAIKAAHFRAPAGKGDRSEKTGITYARHGTYPRDFELDTDCAAARALKGKRAATEPTLGWARSGTGKKRPLELEFGVTPHWYMQVASKGLADLFGKRSLVLDVRTNANGVPEYYVARQAKKGASIEFAWGIRSLDKDNEVVLKVVQKKYEDNPSRLYR